MALAEGQRFDQLHVPPCCEHAVSFQQRTRGEQVTDIQASALTKGLVIYEDRRAQVYQDLARTIAILGSSTFSSMNRSDVSCVRNLT